MLSFLFLSLSLPFIKRGVKLPIRLDDTRQKDNLNIVSWVQYIGFSHWIEIHNYIEFNCFCKRYHYLYCVLVNASMYLNLIGKPNVLYLNQSLIQIENKLKFTDWNENKKENLRFRLFKKKNSLSYISQHSRWDERHFSRDPSSRNGQGYTLLIFLSWSQCN